MICTKLLARLRRWVEAVDHAGAFGLECLNHEQADEAGSANNGRVALLSGTVDAVQGDGNRLSKGGMFVGNVIWNAQTMCSGTLTWPAKAQTAVAVAERRASLGGAEIWPELHQTVTAVNRGVEGDPIADFPR